MNRPRHKSMIPELLAAYDKDVVQMMIDKYQFDPIEAIRLFVTSKTHQMLEDKECEMWEFGPAALFDMWEVEQVTGNPRRSLLIRED